MPPFDFSSLRLGDIFSGNNPEFGGQNPRVFNVPQIDTTVPLDSPDTGLMSLRNRRTPMMEQYRQYLMNAPKRQDYQLGKWGKLGALASGVIEGGLSKSPGRGIDVTRNIAERPYRMAMEDYGQRGQNLGELANIEYRDVRDNIDLESKIAADQIAQAKVIMDWAQTQSGIKLNEARANELANRIKTQGKRLEKNEATGQLEVIDINTGSRQALGKFIETAGEKRSAEHKFFLQREGTQQANRIKLENLRTLNDKNLAAYKADLDTKHANLSPSARNAAWDGAYKQVITEFPSMTSILFTRDDKTGDLVLKTDANGNPLNPDAYQFFIESIHERASQLMGNPSTGMKPGEYEASKDKTVPKKVAPEDEPFRAIAIQAIRDNYPNNPELASDEESIAEAIEQLKAQGIGPESINNNQDPFANLPEAYPSMGPNSMGNFFRNMGNIETLPEAYPQITRPSRTQKELNFRGVSNGRFR